MHTRIVALILAITLFGSACAPQATPTPTPTATPAITATPTLPPNITPSPAPTGFAPVTANAAWSPITREFDGVMMVLVPAGCFPMGSDGINSNEMPEHEQCFNAPFWIDQTEVTYEQFTRFEGQAEETGSADGDNYPRATVTWMEADAFCKLRGVRLPTEREWEYAAAGPDNLTFPWGNEWETDRAAWEDNTNDRPAPVGSYPSGVSWVGALDMTGNVWEWVGSVNGDYPYNPTDGREPAYNIRSQRIMRGGSWANQPDDLIASRRLGFNPTLSVDYVGFRCARNYE